MKCQRKLIGSCALSFGAGVLLSIFLPPVVMVFTVCTHRFLGCDLDYIYGNLERRFPTVRFLRCFMEPITQKEGLSPDQRLRKAMYDPLPVGPAREKTAAILGSGVISRFSLKDAAVYSVFTGTMKALVLGMLIFGGISLAAGLVLLIGSIARERSQVDGLPLKR